ncbi:Uncharacterized protein APZ42_026749 [Daphnia magna]|uniref:Uncharacterized protein n=1 Tax=Daphnia magna TaxID=35525 RepID=A0A0N8CVD6_9CRUS|nr:Uncharacterized protein APZ42_026749 [Daphnia magna]
MSILASDELIAYHRPFNGVEANRTPLLSLAVCCKKEVIIIDPRLSHTQMKKERMVGSCRPFANFSLMMKSPR